MPPKRKAARRKKELLDARDLLVMELKQIHSAENQLSRMLPRVGKAAESEKLQEMIELRQEECDRLLEDLNRCFDEMEESPGRAKNLAAEGLISDTREHIQEVETGPALDAILIAAIQKTEHYCVAAWGTAKALGEALEEQVVVEVMDRALDAGKKYDRELTGLAEQELMPALMEGGEEEEDEEEEEEERGTRRGRGSERRTHA
jgi:ferritin-like metal-binding protein YciE